MEIPVAILVIALIAAVILAVRQQRGHGARGGLGRRRTSPTGRRGRGISRSDPMAAAVADHAQAIDPQDVVVAEQRLRAQSRRVAARLEAEARRSEHQRASDRVERRGPHAGNPWISGDAERRNGDG